MDRSRTATRGRLPRHGHIARPGMLALGVVAICTLGAGVGLITGCGQGDSPLEAVDPDAAPLKPTYDQVAAILYRSCVPCHDSNAGKTLNGEEDDEEESPDLSTCQSVRDNFDSVWSTIENGTMPPGAWPRLSEPEKLLLQRWDRSCP